MKGSGQTALIADDDEFFRMALGTILTSKLGFSSVVQTSSLDEAVDSLSAHPGIDLALFDLAMPGMESPASLRAVRDCFRTLRVAVVSSSKSRAHILAALAAGVHGYVPKSLGVSELERALRQILEGAIYVPPSLAELPASGEEWTPPADHSSKPAMQALTPRQRAVLALLVKGQSNKAIARELKLGEGTVKVHMAALFRSLGVKSRTEAAVAANRLVLPAS